MTAWPFPKSIYILLEARRQSRAVLNQTSSVAQSFVGSAEGTFKVTNHLSLRGTGEVPGTRDCPC